METINRSIGPSFLTELRAANADQVKCSWTSTSITFQDSVSAEDKALVMAVLDAHDAATSTNVSALKAQIMEIERAQPVTQRAIRELILQLGAAFPAAQETLFYQRAAEQEAEIIVIREQLP